MKVFLTGATGFVGRHMLERLLAEGHAVRARYVASGQNARLVATLNTSEKDDSSGSTAT